MAESERLPQPGEILAGKYRIEETIGSGGMSVVFGATHQVTGKRFAIKWLVTNRNGSPGDADEAAKRFMREARVVGKLQHPHVVQVYDFGEVDGTFYMVMEWLEGESLAARLDRAGPMSVEEAWTLLIPCLWAMNKAHDAGVIHRDLKPANVFLCAATDHKPAAAKVLDFGISKLNGLSEAASIVTRTGMLLGTPHYLSPEQLRAKPVDARTDIYAFGVMLYQVLSGELPFPADNLGELALQIATGEATPLGRLVPALPAGVEALVMRAMQREPIDRYQNLTQMIAAMSVIYRPDESSAPRMAASGTHARWQETTIDRPLPSSARIPSPSPSSSPSPSPSPSRRIEPSSAPESSGPSPRFYLGALLLIALAATALFLSMRGRRDEQGPAGLPSTAVVPTQVIPPAVPTLLPDAVGVTPRFDPNAFRPQPSAASAPVRVPIDEPARPRARSRSSQAAAEPATQRRAADSDQPQSQRRAADSDQSQPQRRAADSDQSQSQRRAAEPRPSAARPDDDEKSSGPDHNPLHMDIQ
jgi:serine/threonine protein kinase